MTFKHAIGKSTFEEGFTIPKELWQWIGVTKKGKKKSIVLLFDEKQINATLRRVNNKYGHVQVKYENFAGEEFRRWLLKTFKASLETQCGEYFELKKIDSDKYLVKPFPIETDSSKVLTISQWLFHKGANKFFETEATLREINAITRCIDIKINEGQGYYNKAFSISFKSWGWEREKRVTPELGLKCDFVKNKIHVEVEFGNARAYYQDYIKFLIAYHNKSASIGVLIVPTTSFAKILCDVGRCRAQKKGRKYYSGMIDFEKVYREYNFIKEILSMPIAIAGIGPSKEHKIYEACD